MTLSIFVPKLAEKTKLIIQLLRKTEKFNWTMSVNNFFHLKAFLEAPPVIRKSNTGQPIIVYITILEEAVNVALVQEVKKEEQPIYSISRVLHDAEVRYQIIEKVALTLVITSRRMWMYFQNHDIVVKTHYHIIKILPKPDLARGMIRCQPMGAIKSQTLTDFMVELSPKPTEDEDL